MRVFAGQCHRWCSVHSDGSSWVDPNHNRNVPYLNENSQKRNLNLNDWDDEWNANYRFAAVRNSLLDTATPALRSGSFCCELASPSTEHLSNFRERGRDREVFLVVDHFQFPRELQEELQQIELSVCPEDEGVFVLS